MNLIAIGDIHGCAKSLDALLERLAPTRDDHLIFIGDYIDRGPDSKAVIDRLLRLREGQACTFLRGNHEAFMLTYLSGGDYDLWHVNGGISTLNSYVLPDRRVEIPEEHADFVRETKLYYDTEDFFFVHAGLKPRQTIRENVDRYGEDVFLWERSHLRARTLAWEKPVVCGHTPQPAPVNRDLLIAIDTGCVYHMHAQLGRLTAVRLPEREFVSVPYSG